MKQYTYNENTYIFLKNIYTFQDVVWTIIKNHLVWEKYHKYIMFNKLIGTITRHL